MRWTCFQQGYLGSVFCVGYDSEWLILVKLSKFPCFFSAFFSAVFFNLESTQWYCHEGREVVTATGVPVLVLLLQRIGRRSMYQSMGSFQWHVFMGAWRFLAILAQAWTSLETEKWGADARVASAKLQRRRRSSLTSSPQANCSTTSTHGAWRCTTTLAQQCCVTCAADVPLSSRKQNRGPVGAASSAASRCTSTATSGKSVARMTHKASSGRLLKTTRGSCAGSMPSQQMVAARLLLSSPQDEGRDPFTPDEDAWH